MGVTAGGWIYNTRQDSMKVFHVIIGLLAILFVMVLIFRKRRLTRSQQSDKDVVVQCLIIGVIVGALFAFLSTGDWHSMISQRR